jgi:hypothetical protein
MNMIRQQAINPDLDTALLAPLGHEVDIFLVISFTEKGLLTSVASLGYMMG